MRKRTLITNSLTLSLGTVLSLAIFAYLAPLNLSLSPTASAILWLTLLLGLTFIFTVYLSRKFPTTGYDNREADTILVNETWLLKK